MLPGLVLIGAMDEIPVVLNLIALALASFVSASTYN